MTITFTPLSPPPAPTHHAVVLAAGMAAGVLSLLAILVGVTVNGGASYSCPAGEASDLSLCERVAK